MARTQRGLGKGLDALFQDNDTSDSGSATQIRLSEIEPNRKQPRKNFDESALAELADSINTHGVLQPLLVRPLNNGAYQLVAGERRWRACRMLGLSEVPVVIREMSEEQMMAIALVENLQREDLNPMEEARGYRELIERYDLTQDEIATQVGKSRPTIANAMRLLNLPAFIIEHLEKGEISPGHARAILSLEDEKQMDTLAKEILTKKLNVRESERLAKRIKEPDFAKDKQGKARKRKRDHYYDEMEIALNTELNRKVKIEFAENKGTIHIDFYNKEELADIAERLSK